MIRARLYNFSCVNFLFYTSLVLTANTATAWLHSDINCHTKHYSLSAVKWVSFSHHINCSSGLIYRHGSIVIWQAVAHTQRHQHITDMKSSIFWDISQSQPTFQRNMSSPPSGLKSKPNKKLAWSRQQASKQRLSLQPWWWKWHIPQWTTWHSIPEDRTLHNHWCKNLKSCITGISAYFDYMTVANTTDSQVVERLGQPWQITILTIKMLQTAITNILLSHR
jgi:hypothetical protein